MAIVMNMSGYEVEHEAVTLGEYDDEVLCAGWNPQLALIGNEPVGRMDRYAAFPAELANVDADAFLQKMYRYQR
jgi:hypothetical protein